MKASSALLLTLFAVATPGFGQADEWRWQVESDGDPNRVSVRPRAAGFATLEEALASLDPAQVVESIGLYPMPPSTWEQMQSELLAYFRRHLPDELEAASSSSGNLHNPRLVPLMKGYRQAVRATSYVAGLEETLLAHGYRIVDVSFEKFSMDTRQPSPTFSAATWLLLEKVPQDS